MRKILFSIIIFFTAVILVFPQSSTARELSETEQLLMENGFSIPRDPVPLLPFSGITLKGDSFSLASQHGKLVFLNFWATWCIYCKDEMPVMQEVHEKMNHSNFKIIAVDVGETANQVNAFMAEYGLSFEVVMDTDGQLSMLYGVPGYPATFLIDPSGMIIGWKVGPVINDSDLLVSLFKKIITL